MPACFQLISKATNEPTPFVQIDEEMCAHLGEEVDPKRYYKHWYDCIGFALATGKDWQWCRENLDDLDEVIDYLEERYSTNSWTEVGKR